MTQNDQTTQALIEATVQGDAKAVRRALKLGANVDGFARSEGKLANKAVLIYSKVPLLEAITRGQEDVVAILLEHKATLAISGNTHPSAWTEVKTLWSLYFEPPRILRSLLEAGLDPNLQDPGGKTFLHHLKTRPG